MEGKFKEEARNLIVCFALLYIVLFFAVYFFRSMKRMGEGPLRLVSTQRRGLEEKGIKEKRKQNGTNCLPTSKKDHVQISEIGIEAPIISPGSEEDLGGALGRGVVLLPEGASPGGKGSSILLGRSAPPSWPGIRHDWVFSDLDQLEPGDRVEVAYEGCFYVFEVQKEEILKKGDEIPPRLTRRDDPVLVLIGCWPPGRNYKEVAIVAELKPPQE